MSLALFGNVTQSKLVGRDIVKQQLGFALLNWQTQKPFQIWAWEGGLAKVL